MMTIERHKLAMADLTTREAFKLTEAALDLAIFGSIYSREALIIAEQYCNKQAILADDEAEREVLHAIARYFRQQVLARSVEKGTQRGVSVASEPHRDAEKEGFQKDSWPS